MSLLDLLILNWLVIWFWNTNNTTFQMVWSRSLSAYKFSKAGKVKQWERLGNNSGDICKYRVISSILKIFVGMLGGATNNKIR